MALTPAQFATFGAAIRGDSALALARSTGDMGAIASYYNALANPVMNLWRPSITVSELNTVIDWQLYPTLTQAQRDTYSAMIQSGAVDATSQLVRNGFAAVFALNGALAYTGGPTGTAASGVVQAALGALAQKPATRVQALFTTSQVCAVYGLTVSVADVILALAS